MVQEDKKIKVTVCVVTHNQEKYISQCLGSIMAQETNFDFEVIVGDDCSTDGTQKIINEFAARYPNIIKPVFHKENIGPCNNLISVYKKAMGEYIAHMDGDDFMLPGKLRIQAEELDKNPDCAMCVHAVKQFDQHNQRYHKFKAKALPKKSDIPFLLMNFPFFAHSSKMFRAEYHKDMKLLTDEFLDCYLHIHHALKGKILYLDDFLGVYRFGVGLSTVINNNNHDYAILKTKMLKLAIDAIEYAGHNGVNEGIINRAKAKVYLRYSYYYLMKRDFNRFRAVLNNSIEAAKLGNVQFLFKCFSKVPWFLFLLARLRLLFIE